MPKIASLFGLLEQLDSPKIAVKQQRCVMVRNRNANCLKCLEACTTGCISRSEDGASVVISPDKCIGCGACATACPTGALVPRDPDDSALLRELASKMQAAEGASVAVCQQVLAKAEGLHDPGKVVGVPCLARIDEGLLLALVAMGADSLTLVHGECGSCAHSQGAACSRTVCENANMLLETWGREVRVKRVSKLPASVRLVKDEGYDKSRRAFFQSAGSLSMKAVDEAAAKAAKETLASGAVRPASRYAKVGSDGTLPQSLPNRRARLNAALKALGEPNDEMIETRLWGHVVVDVEKCRGCRMCALFCPTGALRKYEAEDGSCGMTHAPSLCVKCGLCAQVCPAACIELSEAVFASDMVKGVVDRYETDRIDIVPSNSHQTHEKMRKALGIDSLYER